MKKNKIIAVVLVLSMILSGNVINIDATTLNKDESSSVANSGFEEKRINNVKNWTNCTRNTDKNYIKTGNASAKLNGYNEMKSDNISVVSGAVYTIGAYVKTFSQNEYVYMEIIENYADGKNSTTQRIPYFYGKSEDWYKLQGVVCIHDNVSDIKINIVNKSGQAIYIDDVFMIRNTSTLTSELLNEDFESVNEEDGNEYPAGWRIEQTGYYETNTSLSNIDDFCSNSEHYHNGNKSLHIKKSGNNGLTTIANPNLFELEDGYTGISWGLWYKSKNSRTIIKINLNIYDKEKNLIEVLPGNQAVMSGSNEISQWTNLMTTDDIPQDAKYASYEIVFTQGLTDVYIDDIYCKYTENYYEKIVEWNDFSSVSDDGKIGDFEHIGNVNADDGTLKIENGKANKTVYTLKPGYTYEIVTRYNTKNNSNINIIFYDLENKIIEEKNSVLEKTDEQEQFTAKIGVPDNTLYAILEFESDSELEVSNYVIYEYSANITDEVWDANWIWYPEDASKDAIWQYRFFRIYFSLQNKKIKSAYIQFAADDSIQLYPLINENWIGGSTYKENDKRSVKVYEINSNQLVAGKNVITLPVINVNNDAGLIFEGEVIYEDGTTEKIISGVTCDTYVSKLDCTESLSEDTYSNFIKEYEKGKAKGDWRKINYDMNLSGYEWKKAVNLGDADNKVSYCYDYMVRTTFALKTELDNEVNVLAGEKVSINAKVSDIDQFENNNEQVMGKLFSIKGDSIINGKSLATLNLNIKKVDNETIEFELEIPDYLPKGNYELRLDEKTVGLYEYNENIKVKRENNRLVYLNITNNNNESCTSKIEKNDNGSVSLYINDKKTAPVMYLRTHIENYYNYNKLSTIKDSGIELYGTYNGFLNGFDYQYVDGKPMIWKGMDSSNNPVIDYDLFDYEIYRTLELNQNAKIMVQINIDAPEWWKEQNQDELIMHHNGDYIWDTTSRQVSMASKKYKEDVNKVIELIVKHMSDSTYASRVFAIKLTQGRTFEWMTYGVSSGVLVDYSNCAKNSFKEYIKNKYKTEDNLKKAWNNENITFETVDIPTALDRSDAKYISLVDVATQRNVIDYNDFLGQIQSDCLIECAKTVKSVNKDWLVGAYHGYTWSFVASEAIGSAHTAIDDVLNSEYIDFISSPVSYSERISGYSPTAMAMTDSVKAHGKLYFIEQDNRTIYGEVFKDASEDNAVGLTNNLNDSIKQLTRDTCFDLVRGNGFWLYDMQCGWFSNTSIYKRINEIKKEYETEYSTESNSEVAVFVANKNYDYMTSDIVNMNQSSTHYIFNYLYKEQRKQLASIGTSYDTYSLEDLCNGYVDNEYKVNIILSPFEVTEKQRQAIEEKLKKDNKTIVWIYLSGLSDGNSYSSDNISVLTDMNIVFNNSKYSLNATVIDKISKNGDLTENNLKYGNTTGVTGPWTYINDENVNALAKYDDGKIAAAYVKKDNYTSVYSAVPNVCSELLRDICEYSGVHIYSEDASDIIETSKNYIVVNSNNGGNKTIELLSGINYEVYDVFQKKEIEVKDSTFSFKMEKDDTKLFRIVEKKKNDDSSIPETTLGDSEETSKNNSSGNETTTKNNSDIEKNTSKKENVTTKKISETNSNDNSSVSNKLNKVKIISFTKKNLKSKKAKLSFKKVKGAKKYKIQISTNKKFKKILYKKTVKKTKLTISTKKIKNRKKVYIRVKAIGAKKWSAIKKLKIK